ncbi:hypothetical protein ACWEIJ_34275 [Lentzea sp. NPDC004789]
MGRRKNRKLTVGEDQFLWYVSHRCHECHEVLRFRKMGSNGHLLVLFKGMPEEGYRIQDGLLDSGLVRHADGRALNLHEPGVALAVLAEAVARGWDASSNAPAEMNGWELFDGAAARRAGRV